MSGEIWENEIPQGTLDSQPEPNYLEQIHNALNNCPKHGAHNEILRLGFGKLTSESEWAFRVEFDNPTNAHNFDVNHKNKETGFAIVHHPESKPTINIGQPRMKFLLEKDGVQNPEELVRLAIAQSTKAIHHAQHHAPVEARGGSHATPSHDAPPPHTETASSSHHTATASHSVYGDSPGHDLLLKMQQMQIQQHLAQQAHAQQQAQQAYYAKQAYDQQQAMIQQQMAQQHAQQQIAIQQRNTLDTAITELYNKPTWGRSVDFGQNVMLVFVDFKAYQTFDAHLGLTRVLGSPFTTQHYQNGQFSATYRKV